MPEATRQGRRAGSEPAPAGQPDDERRLALPRRIAIVLVGAVLLWRAIGDGLGAFFGPAYADRLGHAVRAALTTAVVVPAVVLARRRLDRRPWAGLGLDPFRSGWRPLLAGAGFWLAWAVLGLAVTLAFGWARLDLGPFDGRDAALAAALPLLVFLAEALPEELIFRGYVYRNLADRIPRWAAVLGQAGLFALWGALIGAAGSADRLILFFTFSVTLGLLRVVAGSLWAAIGFHVIFQSVAQFLAAAQRDGSVTVDGLGEFEVVVFWLFPIVLGGLALAAWSLARGNVGWGRRDPDLP